MDSLFISRHLRISHSEVTSAIEYIGHFVDHTDVNTYEKETNEDGILYYRHISLPIVLAICIKFDKIEMFDPLVLNFELQLA
jgi:hypothetical protein